RIDLVRQHETTPSRHDHSLGESSVHRDAKQPHTRTIVAVAATTEPALTTMQVRLHCYPCSNGRAIRVWADLHHGAADLMAHRPRESHPQVTSGTTVREESSVAATHRCRSNLQPHLAGTEVRLGTCRNELAAGFWAG